MTEPTAENDCNCGLTRLKGSKPEQPKCDHEWLNADNEAVSGAEMCLKCRRIRSKMGEEIEYNPGRLNTNAMIIKTIQGLMSTVNDNLEKLNEETKMLSCHRNALVCKALEEIDLFEKTTLYELQKVFE